MRVSSRRSLPEQIAARIHEQISDGTYPAGSQLPLQKEIAHHFGVSVSRRAREPRAARRRRPHLEPRRHRHVRQRRRRRRAALPDVDARAVEPGGARGVRSRRATCWRAPPSPWLPRRRDAEDVARLRAHAGRHRGRGRRTPMPTPAPTSSCTWRSLARPATGRSPARSLRSAARSPASSRCAPTRRSPTARSTRSIDDYRQLVGAIELGDERRALRALDRMFARSRALARELGLYPDDRPDEAGPKTPLEEHDEDRRAHPHRIRARDARPGADPLLARAAADQGAASRKDKSMTDMLEWWIDDPDGLDREDAAGPRARPDDHDLLAAHRRARDLAAHALPAPVRDGHVDRDVRRQRARARAGASTRT